MKFNVAIDKKAGAVVERGLCINCGECRQVCPTAAAEEYRKTVFCMKSSEDGGSGTSFPDAKKQAVEKACSVACPLGIIPQTVASLIAKGELELAAEHIRERNPMPGICAEVCDRACSEVCNRSVFGDEPLNMRALERYVLSKTEPKPFKYIRKYYEKIAVIGAGPAGLSAAHSLAKAGYPVTVFEKDSEPGGAAFWGIPEFRLDKELVREETERIISAGVEVRYGWHIGAKHSLDELRDEGYIACLIAVGDSYGRIPAIKGADSAGVYDAVRVMRQVTGGYDENVTIGEKVVVVGGGSFAADLSRVLARLGKDVTCVSAEPREDMQMSEKMADILTDEGVVLRTSTAVRQIITELGKVKAVELVNAKDSASNYFCDTVIFAAGQRSVVGDICNAETYPDGKIRIDDEYKTNKEMVFACGDVTGETGSVAEAIAAGRAAAEEMHSYLQGVSGVKKAHVLHNAPDVQALYMENTIQSIPQHEEMLTVSFEESGKGFDAGAAEGKTTFGSPAGGSEPGSRATPGNPAANSMIVGTSAAQSYAAVNAGAGSVSDSKKSAGRIVSGSQAAVARAAVSKRVEHTEDIGAVLRAAGITEDMRAFSYAPDAARVAIAGGGIAGITAAISLAGKGYRPTIFEKEAELGGSYRWLATDKRIDKSVLVNGLKKVEACGIDVIYNVSAGVRPDIGQLFALGYDAVLFAIGTYGGSRHDIDGCGCSGVFDMAALMGKLADNEKITGLGDKILIAGSDEMTFDIARKLREFCSEVTVLSPWSRGFMQKRTGAVSAAVSDGVNLVTGVEVTAVEHKDGRAYDAVCRVTEKGYTIKVPCDTVVLGGGGPDTDTIAMRNLELDVDEDGYFAGNRNLATSIKGVFAIGDFDMSAADAGRIGAAAIDNYLSGSDSYISLGDRKKPARPTEHEIIEGHRKESAGGIEAGYGILGDEEAVLEAGRCMNCAYHSIRFDMCMGCGVCTRVCPVNAIEMVPVYDMRGGALHGAAGTTAGAASASGLLMGSGADTIMDSGAYSQTASKASSEIISGADTGMHLSGKFPEASLRMTSEVTSRLSSGSDADENAAGGASSSIAGDPAAAGKEA